MKVSLSLHFLFYYWNVMPVFWGIELAKNSVKTNSDHMTSLLRVK